MAKLLSRDEILQAQDLPTEDVEVPEWGGAVRVRALTGAERDAFEQSIVQVRGKTRSVNAQNIRARLAGLTMVDEEGNRLFSDKEVEALGRKSAAALDRIFAVAQRLSGLSDRDVEELEGNSETAQSDDSTSD